MGDHMAAVWFLWLLSPQRGPEATRPRPPALPPLVILMPSLWLASHLLLTGWVPQTEVTVTEVTE